MSIIDKATQVIIEHDQSDNWLDPRCLAQDLAQAGLLAQDLPEPRILTPATHPDWAQNWLNLWEWVPDIEFHCESSGFFINIKDSDTNGGFGQSQDEWLDMKPTQLREIASILLAAANYTEEGLK